MQEEMRVDFHVKSALSFSDINYSWTVWSLLKFSIIYNEKPISWLWIITSG